jgi:tripartite-type tricarboxylate transporter receptor subunit TctC
MNHKRHEGEDAMKMNSTGLLLLAAVTCGTAAFAPAAAQDFPNRPIRIIVPTAPGGMSDGLSRTFATKVTERTGHTVLVENRTGAAGVIAANYVAKSPPDGYTIYLGFHGTNSVLQHLDPKLPYDPVKDFAPVVFLATGPNVLVVHPSVPANSVQELVALAKDKPGSLTYASAGIGTTPHLISEQFKLHAGVQIVGTHYRGAAPANQDVIAGHVPMTFDLIGNALGNIREGRFRALAITADKRSPLLPQVPTMGEAGYPDVEAGAWFAFFVPVGTPPAAIAWLNRQANEIFSSPDVKDRLTSQGMIVPLGPPERLREHVEADTQRWGDVIRKAGIKLQ